MSGTALTSRDRRVPSSDTNTPVASVGEAFRARATLEPLVLFVLLPYAVREIGQALAGRVRS